MSVAFRRESDEEHLEPRFELPIPPGPNLVTARGLRLIGERVAALEAARQAGGDEDTLKAIGRDLRYWRARLATATVTAPKAGDEIGFGQRVTLRMNGIVRVLAIVGQDEADAKAGYLAFDAPLARALTGAMVGEIVDLPGQRTPIEILEAEALAKDASGPPSA